MSEEEGFEEQFVQQKPTLIIFHGPPCSGKTKFYKEHYEKTHVRFSMEEWFETSPEATIHSGIRRLAKKLKNGDSVVLDDCNPTEKARSALVSALRKQSIEFTLEGVEFRPKGGILQCSVSAEFLLAAKAEEIERQRLDLNAHIDISDDDEVDSDPDSGSDGEEGNSDKKMRSRGLEEILGSGEDYTKVERRRQELLKEWSSLANGLKYEEGFQLIQFIDQDISVDVMDFEHPTLLIDAQTIISFKQRAGEDFGFDVVGVPHVYENIRDWKKITPGGRVVVIIDDEVVLPALVTAENDSPETQLLMIQTCHKQIMDCLAELECHIPIYYYHIQFGAFEPQSFHHLANLGPISWLLRRHHIDLSRSLWVAPCPKNLTHNVPFSIPYISATEFFTVGGWDMESKIRQFRVTNASLPPWLDFLLNNRSTEAASNVSVHSIDLENRKPDFIPLEVERRSRLQNDPHQINHWISVSEEISFGRTHGCSFPPSEPNKKRPAEMEIEGLGLVSNPAKRSSLPKGDGTIQIHDDSSIPVIDLD